MLCLTESFEHRLVVQAFQVEHIPIFNAQHRAVRQAGCFRSWLMIGYMHKTKYNTTQRGWNERQMCKRIYFCWPIFCRMICMMIFINILSFMFHFQVNNSQKTSGSTYPHWCTVHLYRWFYNGFKALLWHVFCIRPFAFGEIETKQAVLGKEFQISFSSLCCSGLNGVYIRGEYSTINVDATLLQCPPLRRGKYGNISISETESERLCCNPALLSLSLNVDSA